MRFRVQFWDGDRCWGAEHNQTSEGVALLLVEWANMPPKASERVVIEQGDER